MSDLILTGLGLVSEWELSLRSRDSARVLTLGLSCHGYIFVLMHMSLNIICA